MPTSLTFALLVVMMAAATMAQPLSNVIVFVMDDLSPFYLDENHPLKMPNLKSLAQRGVEFSNAHTAFPVCGPSRMALMSGRFADSTKLFTFERFIPQVSGLTTLPKYLGDTFQFDTMGFGKIFHEDKNGPKDVISQAMQSHWNQPFQYGGSADDECPTNQLYCTYKQEQTTGDFKLGTKVIQFLKNRMTNPKKQTKPFVAFVGLRKPHLEWGMPQTFASKPQYGVDDYQKSEPSSIGMDGVEIPFRKSLSRFECFDELNNRRIGKSKILPLDQLSNNTNRLGKIREMYFAASNWADSNVGRIVRFVESTPQYVNNTAMVIVSDHGFSNGEHGLYCKNTLFDQSTRVPFVVIPAKNNMLGLKQVGYTSNNPVGTIDLFPTVVHLATGKELVMDATVDTSNLPLPGRSVLSENGKDVTVYTFSQYPRCELISSSSGWQCVISRGGKCDRLPNTYMGYMVRTIGEKYVEWRHFTDSFTKCDRPNWPGLSSKQRNRLSKMWQIDSNLTQAVWTQPAAQRELFTDYQTSSIPLVWSNWEFNNALLDGNQTKIIQSLEMSAAIRWRFDAQFNGVTQQPCNGHGLVKLKAPKKWTNYLLQPTRADVQCQCVHGWTGLECQTRVA
ncbi:hypothetical protein BASA81_005643 [Batrachochytrium salamandrivorans]|nr:hypothetical protein BASA81_005643 [Batrachochytrium salamandrivorans]